MPAAMDFFERQDHARRRTKLLVFLFGVAVVLTVVTLNVVFALIFRFDPDRPDDWARLWNARLFAGVTGGTLAVIFLGSLVKIMELRQGGSAVAAMLGGTVVHPQTTDLHERRLRNVVEEMALASGVPAPQVYLLGREAEEASHLFFGNGLAESWLGLFSTHPPLVERIRRLDPQFDGSFPRVAEDAIEPTPPQPRADRHAPRMPAPTGFPVPTVPVPAVGPSPHT